MAEEGEINTGKKVVKASLAQFLIFANNIRKSNENNGDQEVTVLNELDEAFLCDMSTWKKFAFFLKGKACMGMFTVNTAKVYLNGAKDAVRSMYPDSDIFIDNEDNKAWQAILSTRMVKEIVDTCIVKGMEFEKKKMAPIGNEGLRKIGIYLIKENKLEDILFWVAFVTGLTFASRSGELVLQDWKFVSWNIVNDVLVVEWMEKKTKTTKTMPVTR